MEDKTLSRSDQPQPGSCTADPRGDLRGGSMHTPGPWKFEHAHIEDGHFIEPRIVSVHPDFLYRNIADIQRPDAPRRLANAHLIAAAPDLYAVLEQALTAIKSLDIDALGETGTNDDSWPLRDELAHRIEVALKKARGEQ